MKSYLFLLLAVASCNCNPPPGPGPIVPVPDAVSDAGWDDSTAPNPEPDGPVPPGERSCRAAYANAVRLQCAMLIPRKGKTWIEGCENAGAHGIDMHLGCLIGAKSCATLDLCLSEE